jgi:hypothetical protein
MMHLLPSAQEVALGGRPAVDLGSLALVPWLPGSHHQSS